MQAADIVGDLHPADPLVSKANDLRRRRFVAAPKLRGDPGPIPSADLRQMPLRAVKIEGEGEAIFAGLGRSQPQFIPPPRFPFVIVLPAEPSFPARRLVLTDFPPSSADFRNILATLNCGRHFTRLRAATLIRIMSVVGLSLWRRGDDILAEPTTEPAT